MLSLDAIAASVQPTARTHGAEVAGVTPAGHDSSYAEVILTLNAPSPERSRLVVDVNREAPVSEVRQRVSDSLRAHARDSHAGRSY